MDLLVTLVTVPVILALGSAFAGFCHTMEEVLDDGGPIWTYLGITPNYAAGLGLLLGFYGVQVYLAAVGYLWPHPPALYALAAIRIGDCVYSHWRPWLAGRRPNPGIRTSLLYALDAVIALLVAVRWVY